MKSNPTFARSAAAILAAVSLLALAAPALAQRGGGGGGGGMPSGTGMSMPSGMGTVDRTRDQDRLRDPASDQDRDRDQDRLHDGTGDRDQDQDRDRDRLHDGTGDQDRDQDRLRDRDRITIDQAVSGQMASWQLLGEQERLQFHNRMKLANSEQERSQIRSEFQNTIRQRAADLGVDAPFGPQRDGSGMRDGYYMAQMLTEQERLQFHQRMRAANTAEERNRIRNEMQVTARERAQEMGIDMPAWYGAGPAN